MVNLLEASLQAMVVELAVGRWPEAIPQPLNQVFVGMLRGVIEGLFCLGNPCRRTHNCASIARRRRLQRAVGCLGSCEGIRRGGCRYRVSRCLGVMRYSDMIERAAVCRRKIDAALLMGEQQTAAFLFGTFDATRDG